MINNKSIDAYSAASGSEAHYATPHRLVQMLMEGALEKIAIAKGAIERHNIEQRQHNVTWAVSIIDRRPALQPRFPAWWRDRGQPGVALSLQQPPAH